MATPANPTGGAADPLSTDPPPAPAPVPRESNRKIVCEFCECQLTPAGEVMRMGDKAKQFRNHTETMEKKDKEITKLSGEITELKAKIASLESGSTPRGGHRPGSRIGG